MTLRGVYDDVVSSVSVNKNCRSILYCVLYSCTLIYTYVVVLPGPGKSRTGLRRGATNEGAAPASIHRLGDEDDRDGWRSRGGDRCGASDA